MLDSGQESDELLADLGVGALVGHAEDLVLDSFRMCHNNSNIVYVNSSFFLSILNTLDLPSAFQKSINGRKRPIMANKQALICSETYALEILKRVQCLSIDIGLQLL